MPDHIYTPKGDKIVISRHPAADDYVLQIKTMQKSVLRSELIEVSEENIKELLDILEGLIKEVKKPFTNSDPFSEPVRSTHENPCCEACKYSPINTYDIQGKNVCCCQQLVHDKKILTVENSQKLQGL